MAIQDSAAISEDPLSVRLTSNASPMGVRVRSHDWSNTPLGPIQKWPQSLSTAVDILVSSRYAMWMAWGPELVFLCNDAYRPTLGLKDPWALGSPAMQVWAEIWPEIGPRVETVLTTGVGTYDEGLLLFLQRSGFREETYHTFSYSPLTNDDRQISGMLCVVTEETERVIGERRVATLRDVASALAGTNTEAEVLPRLENTSAATGKTCRSHWHICLIAAVRLSFAVPAELILKALWRRSSLNQDRLFRGRRREFLSIRERVVWMIYPDNASLPPYR
jgi:hypothetical protein